MSYRVSQVTLTIISVLLGILAMAQFHTHNLTSKTRVSASSADQSIILSNLVEANASLRAEIETLETQLNRYQSAGNSGLLETLVEELNRLKTVNGLVEVSGPGLQLRLSGPLSVLNAQGPGERTAQRWGRGDHPQRRTTDPLVGYRRRR